MSDGSQTDAQTGADAADSGGMSPQDFAGVDGTEGPDAPIGDAQTAAGDGGSGGVYDMFMSTEPDVSPQDVSGSFDMSVPWTAHAEVAFQKITGSGGVPAVVNLLSALVIGLRSAAEQANTDDGSTDDAIDGDGLLEDMPDGEEP